MTLRIVETMCPHPSVRVFSVDLKIHSLDHPVTALRSSNSSEHLDLLVKKIDAIPLVERFYIFKYSVQVSVVEAFAREEKTWETVRKYLFPSLTRLLGEEVYNHECPQQNPKAESKLPPEDWIFVPTIGARVTVDYPITVANPEKTFCVYQIKVEKHKAYVRGENTMWFDISMVEPAEDENNG